MRIMSGRGNSDRGVTTVFIAIMMVVLTGMVAFSVDFGTISWEHKRAQNAADASALAIAADCSAGNVLGCSTVGALTTAQTLTTQNANGATPALPVPNMADSTARVTVGRDVSMTFARVFGLSTVHVSATAKATWVGHPVEGSPFLPLAVPYCLYKNNLPPATTPLLLRSDLISAVFNVVVQGGVLGRVLSTLLGDLAPAQESCTNPDGNDVVMLLRGPVWLSGIDGTVNGTYNWNSSICNMHLDYIKAFVGGTSSALIPSNCVNKLGNQIKQGQIITLPVYLPANNLLSVGTLGFQLDDLGLSVVVPPRLGVNVIGFAPFRITGWNYPGNVQLDPNAPACADLVLDVHPAVSIGCDGIQGYFVKNMQADPNFAYTPDGTDLGANGVRLIE